MAFVACYIFADRQRESLAGLSSIGAIAGFAAALLVAGHHLAVIVGVLLAPAAHRAGGGDSSPSHPMVHSRALADGTATPPESSAVPGRFLMPLFDRKDKSRYAAFTRRTLMPDGAMRRCWRALGAAVPAADARAATSFATKAEDNSVSARLVAPPRGRIFDRFGVELATNRRNYRVLSFPSRRSKAWTRRSIRVGKMILLSDRDRSASCATSQTTRSSSPHGRGKLYWEEFSRSTCICPISRAFSPMSDRRATIRSAKSFRTYSAMSPRRHGRRQEDDDSAAALPGFRIGKRGIEKSWETELRGSAGVSRDEVNAYGRVIRELSRDAGRTRQGRLADARSGSAEVCRCRMWRTRAAPLR